MPDGYDVVFSPIDMLRQLPRPATEQWPEGVWDLEVWKDSAVSLSIFAPNFLDHQTPHDRDELYVVIRGSGTFVCGPTRHDFGPGDVLIVPAGVEHRFERFDPTLVTWVLFWDGDGSAALAGSAGAGAVAEALRAAVLADLELADGDELRCAEPVVDGVRAVVEWQVVRSHSLPAEPQVVRSGVDVLTLDAGGVVDRRRYLAA